MTRPPRPSLDAASCFATLLGGMLCVLLAALLGVAWLRSRGNTRSEVMAAVLPVPEEVDWEIEEWVEWVAVPAPWRSVSGARRHHARKRRAGSRGGAVRPAALGRGPPWGLARPYVSRTGMATGRCAGARACAQSGSFKTAYQRR